MTNTVYILGAGVNKEIRHHQCNELSPPTINNFFQVAFRIPQFVDAQYTEQMRVVYDYIYKYWKKDESELANIPFDLEECFTMIELHLNEAIKSGNTQLRNKLFTIQFRLKMFLAEVLHQFEIATQLSSTMRQFGIRLHKEEPVIITFNYDNFIEITLEASSGFTELNFPSQSKDITDEQLDYKKYNWTRRLGYGIEFDKVLLDISGLPKYVEGKRFYSRPQNKLYFWSVLKLHGSLNWFRYLPIREMPTVPGQQLPTFAGKGKHIVLSERLYWFNKPLALDGWLLDPLIITPTLYKAAQFSEAVYEKIPGLWEKAKSALSSCKKLVVIGYSFPPTDFATKRLCLEAFSDNQMNELIIVNPDDVVVQKVKNLCHFERTTQVFDKLDKFLSNCDV
jgi:hypothetical protein